MNEPRETWKLPGQLCQRAWVYDALESTNDVAMQLSVDPANEGLAILAKEQSSGRGQHGRSWLAAPESSVLLSLIVAPPAAIRRPVILTAWAAVAVCSTVERLTNAEPRIKWPNDVLIGDRKVCGILIEQGVGIVVGIGLNVTQTARDFSDASLPDATSLQQYTQEPLSSSATARTLLEALDETYTLLCHGDVTLLEREWNGYLDLQQQYVCIECAQTEHIGTLRDVTFDQVEFVDGLGEIHSLIPEQINHITLVSK